MMAFIWFKNRNDVRQAHNRTREVDMDLIYKSTRNNQETATASEAILKGLAGEGGLFVPSYIPKLDKSLEELSKMSYQEVAY